MRAFYKILINYDRLILTLVSFFRESHLKGSKLYASFYRANTVQSIYIGYIIYNIFMPCLLLSPVKCTFL